MRRHTAILPILIFAFFWFPVESLNYKCHNNQVLVVQSFGNDTIRMHCQRLDLCGYQKLKCDYDELQPQCGGKLNFVAHVNQKGSTAPVEHTCCNLFNPRSHRSIPTHTGNDCFIYELPDGSSNGKKVDPAPADDAPYAVLKNPAEIPEQFDGVTGYRLRLFLLKNKSPPTLLVKGIERRLDGYRVTICRPRCTSYDKVVNENEGQEEGEWKAISWSSWSSSSWSTWARHAFNKAAAESSGDRIRTRMPIGEKSGGADNNININVESNGNNNNSFGERSSSEKTEASSKGLDSSGKSGAGAQGESGSGAGAGAGAEAGSGGHGNINITIHTTGDGKSGGNAVAVAGVNVTLNGKDIGTSGASKTASSAVGDSTGKNPGSGEGSNGAGNEQTGKKNGESGDGDEHGKNAEKGKNKGKEKKNSGEDDGDGNENGVGKPKGEWEDGNEGEDSNENGEYGNGKNNGNGKGEKGEKGETNGKKPNNSGTISVNIHSPDDNDLLEEDENGNKKGSSNIGENEGSAGNGKTSSGDKTKDGDNDGDENEGDDGNGDLNKEANGQGSAAGSGTPATGDKAATGDENATGKGATGGKKGGPGGTADRDKGGDASGKNTNLESAGNGTGNESETKPGKNSVDGAKTNGGKTGKNGNDGKSRGSVNGTSSGDGNKASRENGAKNGKDKNNLKEAEDKQQKGSGKDTAGKGDGKNGSGKKNSSGEKSGKSGGFEEGNPGTKKEERQGVDKDGKEVKTTGQTADRSGGGGSDGDGDDVDVTDVEVGTKVVPNLKLEEILAKIPGETTDIDNNLGNASSASELGEELKPSAKLNAEATGTQTTSNGATTNTGTSNTAATSGTSSSGTASGTTATGSGSTSGTSNVASDAVAADAAGSTGGSGGGRSNCFSAESLVTTVTGQKRMDELQVGDFVLVPSAGNVLKYERVEMFYHREPETRTSFVIIYTKSGKKLSLTGRHLLPVADCSVVNEYAMSPDGIDAALRESKYAEKARKGECVLSVDSVTREVVADEIVRIGRMNNQGIYSPMTVEGSLIVDGVLSSCFSHLESHAAHKLIFDFIYYVYNAFGLLNTSHVDLQPIPTFVSFAQYLSKTVLPFS